MEGDGVGGREESGWFDSIAKSHSFSQWAVTHPHTRLSSVPSCCAMTGDLDFIVHLTPSCFSFNPPASSVMFAGLWA